MQHCPPIEEGIPYKQSIKYWIYWNRMVERAELRKDLYYLRYRIEDLGHSLLTQILELIQFPINENILDEVLKILPRDFNTRGNK